MPWGSCQRTCHPNSRSEARGIARRIIGPYLDVGGGAAGAASAYSISSLFDDVLAAALKLPTSLPPDMILLARAVIQFEGLALRAYPDYRLVDDILPVAARRSLYGQRMTFPSVFVSVMTFVLLCVLSSVLLNLNAQLVFHFYGTSDLHNIHIITG